LFVTFRDERFGGKQLLPERLPVVEAGLQDDEVVAVDEVDTPARTPDG
jgi:hypothetical protein